MEHYPIPQFIESEGKIAFFLSFKQFFYLVGAGIICFFLFYILPFPIFVVAAVIVFGCGIALAFVSVNGMPVLDLILKSVGFSMGGKNYTWKKKESPYPFRPIQRTQIKKVDNGPVLQAQQSQLKKTKMSVDLKTR